MPHELKLETVGAAIRGLRLDAGLTQQVLAKRLGWSVGTVSKYETNRLALSLRAIEQIAEAIGKHTLEVVFECLKVKFPRLQVASSKERRLMLQTIEHRKASRDGKSA